MKTLSQLLPDSVFSSFQSEQGGNVIVLEKVEGFSLNFAAHLALDRFENLHSETNVTPHLTYRLR